MKDAISEAVHWTIDVWKGAAPAWEDRNQDHNYREIIARPGIYAALESLEPISDGVFLDVGCGDGAETFYIRDSLVNLGCSGKMFGYDPQSSLIGAAENDNKYNSTIPIQFANGSIEGFLKMHDLSKNVNLLTSIFVIQELPDIERYLADMDKALTENGTGIFLLVHPEFGESMRRKDVVKIEDSLNPEGTDVPWRFVCEYPIVEENGRTFFVPYFQRDVEDYRTHLQNYFNQTEFVALKPSVEDIKRCEKEQKSPFYKHTGNVYYPEIVEMESSLIIIAKR